MKRLICTGLTLLALGAAVHADNWPAWRGPDGQGHTAEKNLPSKWGPTENIKWKLPLPDDGNSTPIVWGERVFLTQAIGKGANSKRMLWCLDRADGKAGLAAAAVTNPFSECSPSRETSGRFRGGRALPCPTGIGRGTPRQRPRPGALVPAPARPAGWR